MDTPTPPNFSSSSQASVDKPGLSRSKSHSGILKKVSSVEQSSPDVSPSGNVVANKQVRNPYVQSSRKAALGVTDTHHTAMMSVTRRKSMETCTSAAFWSAPEFQDQPLPARDSSYRRRSFSSSGAQLARQRTPDDDPAWIQASQTYPAAQAEGGDANSRIRVEPNSFRLVDTTSTPKTPNTPKSFCVPANAAGAASMRHSISTARYQLSRPMLEGFRSAFNTLDLNSSGAVSSSELRRLLRSFNMHLGPEEVTRLFEGLTGRYSSHLNETDYMNVIAMTSSNMGLSLHQVQHVFRMMDSDRDGYICASELKAALNKLDEHPSDREITAMMKDFDHDGDGRLSLHEFYEFINTCPLDNPRSDDEYD
mmetsp:Transcript_5171/g.9830  ORF Transcript_5171/g.9830 Transcript_5171/m.9830 type:complete len:366 (+) Transcript_5171:267-1364(+)|eukprot:CAMPEP_0114235328 /NCGR_PEP_ID=MMETSP0058-20121206/6190_1 /TAXON_ID=36894 /ORGANISM="Pyramimonas parkeae, CCMP726" /LENGTH=365 /DNA_ID=CAMNT_0001347079 /DNA_START=239 /DNA_END=1336 /DNA_ORIENTATION=+